MDQRCEKHGEIFPRYGCCPECLKEGAYDSEVEQPGSISETLHVDEEARIRADEREKIAAEIEAAADDPLWPPLRMAEALRSGTDTEYVCVRREWLENEVLPLVEEAEFLQSHAYSYGCDPTDPSPPEWGIQVGYQQQEPDKSPGQMYGEDIRRFHQENLEEDDDDGEFLTVANRLRSLLKEKD